MTDRIENGVRAGGRILVVDDEEAIRQIIVSMLTTAGFECREAGGGLGALAVLESGERFDLVLSDLMMAEMDGISLLERSKNKYPDVPVVITASAHDIHIALEVFRKGGYDYLLKPFQREELLAIVRRALEHRRLMLEHRAYVSSLESQVATLTEQLRARSSR